MRFFSYLSTLSIFLHNSGPVRFVRFAFSQSPAFLLVSLHTPDCLDTEECNKRQHIHRLLAFIFQFAFCFITSINVSGKQTKTMEQIKTDFVTFLIENSNNNNNGSSQANTYTCTICKLKIHETWKPTHEISLFSHAAKTAIIQDLIRPKNTKLLLFQNFQHYSNWCDCATTTTKTTNERKPKARTADFLLVVGSFFCSLGDR